MKYKAIIFDMDGTIIDTEHIWKQANRDLLSSRGITLTPELEQELSQRLSGHSMVECCRIIKEMLNLSEAVETLYQEKAIIADRIYKSGIRFIEGFLEFHQKAVQMNLKVGLATNATDQTVQISKKLLDLERLFGVHIYNSSHVQSQFKPHPAIYLHAAAQLGHKPEECIAIEDSKNGVTSAVAAGMYCIGINTAKKPELIAHSHQIINEYHEIDLISLLELTILK
jgi:HAD superfamily hydrolase (TIGR01509 family)